MIELTSAVLLAGLVAAVGLAATLVVRTVRNARRHHNRANKRFLAGYRAGFRAAHMPANRAAAEQSRPPALPHIRHRLLAGVITAPTGGHTGRVQPDQPTATAPEQHHAMHQDTP